MCSNIIKDTSTQFGAARSDTFEQDKLEKEIQFGASKDQEIQVLKVSSCLEFASIYSSINQIRQVDSGAFSFIV